MDVKKIKLKCPDCETEIMINKNTCPACPNCGFKECDGWIEEDEE